MKIDRIIVERKEEKPHYGPLAGELLREMRDFFSKPENEAEFQQWMETRDKEGNR